MYSITTGFIPATDLIGDKGQKVAKETDDEGPTRVHVDETDESGHVNTNVDDQAGDDKTVRSNIPLFIIDSEDEAEEDNLEGNGNAHGGNNSDDKFEKLSDSGTFGVHSNYIP